MSCDAVARAEYAPRPRTVQPTCNRPSGGSLHGRCAGCRGRRRLRADPTWPARVSLLGPMHVEFGAEPLHVAGPQRRRLLAVLACRAGRVVPVEALIDAMWGDDPPPTAAKTLQSHVVRLRQSLAGAGDAIETGPGGYRLLVQPDSVDAARFEALADQGAGELRHGHFVTAVRLLEAAEALWRGPALMEFADDDFALGDRARLEERRLVAHEDLAEARLASGGASAVVADMERSVAMTPARERSWALLMRALYASGRQREALAAFQRARTTLGEEFGLEPGPQLRELERRVVAQDPTLTIARRASPPCAAPCRLRTRRARRRGRLAALGVATSRGGRGPGAVVLGANGSGRTRMIAEVATIVYRGRRLGRVRLGRHRPARPRRRWRSWRGRRCDRGALSGGAVAAGGRRRAVDAVDEHRCAPGSVRSPPNASPRCWSSSVTRAKARASTSCESSTAVASTLPWRRSDRAVAEILVRDGIEPEAIDAVVALATASPVSRGVRRRRGRNVRRRNG